MVLLCGGVGGARMAQGFRAIMPADNLTLLVNVGDDEYVYGAYVAADLDTVTYTLAGIQSPAGWGVTGDSFIVMSHLESLGIDVSFRLGDRDLAYCLARSDAMTKGEQLSTATRRLAAELGVKPAPLPVTDDPIRTRIRTPEGTWHSFQDYFVRRGHRDRVVEIDYHGAGSARPAPGAIEAIEQADLIVIAPSNPPMSIMPMLAIPAIGAAVRQHARVCAVSPFFNGRALKGPAAEVMASLGYGTGTAGLLEAYEGVISDLIVDANDANDVLVFAASEISLHATDTRIAAADDSQRLAEEILSWTT